ncbi:MAG: 3,4-dihydroxy-2-butanone-4-phosphate synthase [Thermoplasmata archaeon]|nr:3,4-dihydroxy-2-butanone-4-phosphate synthase [Thermoplasmata archaeon]
MKLDEALEALRKGEFVLIYDADGREEETDFFMAAQFVTHDAIHQMRRDGGGLIFMAIAHEIASKLGLPYLADVIYKCGHKWHVFKELIPNDIPYDTRSSFSLPLNHRRTFTGISDRDRALTISKFAELAERIGSVDEIKAQALFGSEFRSPGHVATCIASKGLLNERQGHTELAVAMAKMAGLTPVMAGCEMLGIEKSLSKSDAIKYAEEHGLIWLEGKDIIEAWRKWQE